MIKKYSKSKMFAIALTALCLYEVPVFAKSVTLDTIGTDTAELTEKLYGDNPINFFYVIGEYAYTNRHEIVFNDITAGSRTIPTSIADKDMTIYFIEKDGDSWKVSDKIGGNLDLPESFVISKVDNERLYSAEVDTDEAVNQLVNTANDAIIDNESGIKDAFEINYENRVITVKLLNRKLTTSDIHDTGLATVITEIFNNKNYAGIKLTEIPTDSEVPAKTATILNTEGTTTATVKQSVLGFFNSIGVTSSLDDLAGKAFTLEFLLADEDIANAEDAVNSYKFEFVSEVDTNDYFAFATHGKNYNTSCGGAEDEKCLPVLDIIKGTENFVGANDFGYVVENALKDKLIASVDVTFGNVNATYTSADKTGILNKINTLIKSSNITKYSDFASETYGITIKFNVATDKGAVSKYEDTSYKYEIGSFVDFDAPIEALVTASANNNYVGITQNGNVITMDVKLNNNAVDLRKIVDLLYNTLTDYKDKMTIKLGDVAYVDTTDSSGNQSIRQAFWHLLPVSQYADVTPGIMANADDLVITLSSQDKTAFPGTVGELSEDEKTATYIVKFTVSGFDVDNAATGYAAIQNNYFDMTYVTTSDEDVITSRDLTVQLKNLTTKFSEFVGTGGTGLLAGLQKYADTFTVTVNGEALDLTDTTAMATALPKALGITLDSTVNDLAGKTATVVITLNDNVNLAAEGETRVDSYTINVAFRTDNAVVEFDGTKSLSSLIAAGVEKVILTDDVSISSGLTLNKDFEIDGKGHDITTNVTLEGNIDLKLSNVELIGKVTVAGTNSEVTITGDENTVIKGSIDASDTNKVKSLNITSVKVEGTPDDLVGSSSKSVIDATGAEEFVMTGSSVKYNGDDSDSTGAQIYSLVKVDGNTTIKNSKFDIAKIKNPIEFKYYGGASARITKIDIIDNEFTGDNYVATDSHNVISVYSLAEGAVVNIMRNKFEYANSAIRISNNGTNTVTFNVVDNIVEKYNEDDTTNRGLIVIRPNTTNADLSKITISHRGNMFGEDAYVYDKDTMTTTSDTRLVYVNDKDGKSITNYLDVTDYPVQP